MEIHPSWRVLRSRLSLVGALHKLGTESGCMSDVLANIYQLTGDKKWSLSHHAWITRLYLILSSTIRIALMVCVLGGAREYKASAFRQQTLP